MYNFPVNIHGQLGSHLGIKPVPQVFFAKCMKCGKYDWKFGYYNGWVHCSTCIEAKVLECKERYAEHIAKEEAKLNQV